MCLELADFSHLHRAICTARCTSRFASRDLGHSVWVWRERPDKGASPGGGGGAHYLIGSGVLSCSVLIREGVGGCEFGSVGGAFHGSRSSREIKILAWPSLQSLAVKKKLFFVQILGGEKLLKFGEKWAVKNF